MTQTDNSIVIEIHYPEGKPQKQPHYMPDPSPQIVSQQDDSDLEPKKLHDLFRQSPQVVPQGQEDSSFEQGKHIDLPTALPKLEQPEQEGQEDSRKDQENPAPSDVRNNNVQKPGFSKRATTIGRLAIFAVVIGLLFMGRFSVPDNAVACIEDKVLEGLKAANDYINNPQNEAARRIFQTLCSFFIDVTFIATFGYWVFKGSSWRLPLSLGVFYLVRIFVQKFWFSPFPQGFIWSSTGFPSLVVPYGQGSDFFYSGHTGFVTICAREWHKIGSKIVRNLIILVGIYTIMILLIYRVHYSIDIFTGLFFADWCFLTADANKELYDSLWLKVTLVIKQYLVGKKEKKVVA